MASVVQSTETSSQSLTHNLGRSVFPTVLETVDLARPRHEFSTIPALLFNGANALIGNKHRQQGMAGIPLSFLFLLLCVSIAHASDSEALGRVISDLGLHGQGLGSPCAVPGVSCEASFFSLRATRLVLPARRLEGFISASVGRLSSLRELSLPNNQLSSVIPGELAACRALEVLDLHGNQLSGQVPREFSSLVSLRTLDLSSNQFHGDLGFLQHFPNLEKLSLADNLFSGRVPRSLSSFRNLVSLDLSNNPGLHGDVPQPVAHLSLSRRSLPLPKRYIFAEKNTTSNHSSRFPALANAPAPSPSESKHHEHNKKKRIRNWIIGFFIGTVSGIISGLVLSVLFRMLLNCIRGRFRNPAGPNIYSQLIKRAEELDFLMKEDGLASLEKIGEGGSGQVYKAQLEGREGQPGRMIAIKRILKHTADGGEPSEEDTQKLDKWMRQIKSEIDTVGRIRHRNLLPLLAHVARPDCHYLIYEFMKNGSLRDTLRDADEGRRELDWPTRHRIALGIAAGLEYLHVHQSPRIIHRDLKTANILLDDDLEARIADFGLAKHVPDANTHMTTSNVAGTAGYIAPEYHQLLKFTDKCDIYSFGIILAVLVVGKEPTDEFFQQTDEMSIVKWLRNLMRSNNPSAAIHPKLMGNGFEEQMLLVLKIACFCTADDPKERPNSKEIRSMLSQIKP